MKVVIVRVDKVRFSDYTKTNNHTTRARIPKILLVVLPAAILRMADLVRVQPTSPPSTVVI